jgi:hypothetical protein
MSNATLFFLVKVLTSGLIIAAVSTLAKTFPKWAALLTALPLITFLSLIWIYAENKDLALLERYVHDVVLWLIPGLAFFLSLILLFRARVPFFWSMTLSTGALAGGVLLFNKLGILK